MKWWVMTKKCLQQPASYYRRKWKHFFLTPYSLLSTRDSLRMLALINTNTTVSQQLLQIASDKIYFIRVLSIKPNVAGP